MKTTDEKLCPYLNTSCQKNECAKWLSWREFRNVLPGWAQDRIWRLYGKPSIDDDFCFCSDKVLALATAATVGSASR